jgi:hypothetical protein
LISPSILLRNEALQGSYTLNFDGAVDSCKSQNRLQVLRQGLDPTVVSPGAIGIIEGQLGIHSQLKSPSSSEVASMIEGVIRHYTEMKVDPLIRRFTWPGHGRLRVLPSPGFPAAPAAQGDPFAEAIPA